MNDKKAIQEVIAGLHDIRAALYGIDCIDFGLYQDMILILVRMLEKEEHDNE